MAGKKGGKAKLAHEAKGSGKSICPVCNSEIKQIKFIKSKISDKGGWSPNYVMENVCKCNENELLK